MTFIHHPETGKRLFARRPERDRNLRGVTEECWEDRRGFLVWFDPRVKLHFVGEIPARLAKGTESYAIRVGNVVENYSGRVAG